MTEVYVPRGHEAHNSTFSQVGQEHKKPRPNFVQNTVKTLTVLVAIGSTACQDGQFKIPYLNRPPAPTVEPYTPTPPPTPTETPRMPTLTPHATPTIIPTATPRPTEISRPTSTPRPTPEPRLIPTERAPVPTKTPRPTSTPRPTPTPRPAPSPTHEPTLAPPEVPISELRVGDPPLNRSRCFYNDIKPGEIKKRSADFESTGLQTLRKTYPGNIDNIKREISVPLTQKEIQAKKAKDPNNKETTKIVKENASFDVDEMTTCIRFKTSLFSGSSDDCYRTLALNYRTREGSTRDNLLYKTTILENFCTGFVLKGSIKEEFYKYDPVTNILTTVVVIENPAEKTFQETTLKLGKPCSFLEFAEQTVRNASTDSRIFPDKPQTIPPKTTVYFVWESKYPYGKQPIPPYYCTFYLKPTRK